MQITYSEHSTPWGSAVICTPHQAKHGTHAHLQRQHAAIPFYRHTILTVETGLVLIVDIGCQVRPMDHTHADILQTICLFISIASILS